MNARYAFNVLAILGTGTLAGVLLTIGLSFGGFWRSLPPADFLSWFAANSQFVPRPVPIASAVAVLGVVGSLWIGWSAPRERWLWLGVLACIAVMFAITAIWNGPLNGRFAGGQMPTSEVAGALKVWLTAHYVRISLLVVAAVLAAAAAIGPGHAVRV